MIVNIRIFAGRNSERQSGWKTMFLQKQAQLRKYLALESVMKMIVKTKKMKVAMMLMGGGQYSQVLKIAS